MSTEEIRNAIQAQAISLKDGIYAYQEGEIRNAEDAIASDECVDTIFCIFKGECLFFEPEHKIKCYEDMKRLAAPVGIAIFFLENIAVFEELSKKLKGTDFASSSMHNTYWGETIPNHWIRNTLNPDVLNTLR